MLLNRLVALRRYDVAARYATTCRAAAAAWFTALATHVVNELDVGVNVRHGARVRACIERIDATTTPSTTTITSRDLVAALRSYMRAHGGAWPRLYAPCVRERSAALVAYVLVHTRFGMRTTGMPPSASFPSWGLIPRVVDAHAAWLYVAVNGPDFDATVTRLYGARPPALAALAGYAVCAERYRRRWSMLLAAESSADFSRTRLPSASARALLALGRATSASSASYLIVGGDMCPFPLYAHARADAALELVSDTASLARVFFFDDKSVTLHFSPAALQLRASGTTLRCVLLALVLDNTFTAKRLAVCRCVECIATTINTQYCRYTSAPRRRRRHARVRRAVQSVALRTRAAHT